MTCRSCGAEVVEGAGFCGQCGASQSADTLDVSSSAESPPSTAQELWQGLITGALAMKESVYEEARDDERATPVAIVTVAASILIFALGGYLMIAIEFDADWEAFWKSVLAGSAIGFGLWLCWVGVTRFVLASVFAQEIDVKALARVHGLAAAPSIIGFAMLIPLVSFGFALIGIVVWVLSTTLAIQSAFRIPLRSAIWSNLAGFAIWSLVIPVIATTENPLGPGIFWFDWTKDFTATIADLFEGLGSE